MILITGAAGKTGRAIIASLISSGQTVKAFVFKDDYANAIYSLGVGDVVVGNLLNPADVKNALKDADALYHICPNMHPEEVAIGHTVIKALRSSECRRIVYHSVLHPHTSTMPHHWKKLQVEEALLASGLDYTILQPSAYIQNIFHDLDNMLTKGVYNIPYHPDSTFSFVDLNDVAEAACRVLTMPGHRGAIYELNGPEVLSLREVMKIITALTQTDIIVQQQSRADWLTQPVVAGFSDYKKESLCRMFDYYDQYGFWGNSNVLKWLLGRPPTTIREALSRELNH